MQNLFNAMSFHEIKISRENNENIIESDMILAKDIPLSDKKFHSMKKMREFKIL